jgi:asparagine synthase (glutamine-hydrolysing)
MVQREWTEFDAVKDNVTSIDDIKVALEAAVHRQLMSDVPYGVLLSGGLILLSRPPLPKYAQNVLSQTSRCLVSTIAFFSVGLEGSPLAAAQK